MITVSKHLGIDERAYMAQVVSSIHKGAKFLGAFAHRSALAPVNHLAVVCEFSSGQRFTLMADCTGLPLDNNLQAVVEADVSTIVTMAMTARIGRSVYG